MNLVLKFSIVLIGAGLFTSQALGQENCKVIVSDAEDSYRSGDFDRTFSLLQENCFNLASAQLDSATGVAVYRLLALTFIARNSLDSAQAAVDKMTATRVSKKAVTGDSLLFFNEYPDDLLKNDPPTFVAMVKKAEQPYRERVKKMPVSGVPLALGRSVTNRWWFKISAPVLAAGITYYLARKKEKKLPDPPALPSQ